MDFLTPVNLAALLIAAVALAHLTLVIHDGLNEPRYLKPADKPLLNRMKRTTAALAPGGRSYWQALIGAQLGHILGLMLLVLLIEMARSPLLAWLRLPLIGVGAAHSLIAWRCWFPLPAGVMGLATALLAVGWLGG